MPGVPWTHTGITALAILAGLLAARRSQSKLGLTPGQRWGISLGALCGGLVAARLPFVLADWNALCRGTAWFASGKTLLLGLAGGYLGVEAAKWSLRVRIRTGDSFAVPVALGIGIGRWACLAAGCCYGTPTSLPWGIDFGDGLRRHPTQIYESIFHLAAAALLAAALRRGWLRGQLIKVYILAYAAYRMASELIRPEPRLWFGLTGYQWAALALAGLFGWLLWRDLTRYGPNA
jgi:phosphatidylglycerol:prolipoprotein diacylglycerol transferase